MSPRSFLALICIAALWAAFPTIANAMPAAASANEDAARPGYGWSRPKHIQPLLESGHPSGDSRSRHALLPQRCAKIGKLFPL